MVDAEQIEKNAEKFPEIKIMKVDELVFANQNDFEKFLNTININENNLFVFISDIYQIVCIKKLPISDLEYRLNELKKYGKIVPSIDFMHSTGTKEYAIVPEIRKLLLPGTVFYPAEIDKIKNLPTDNYIYKYGLSSASKGIQIVSGDGNAIMQNIINTEHELFCSEFITIQKISTLFNKCYEWRFIVFQDKIYSMVASGATLGKFFRTLQDNIGKKLNSKIYGFIKNLINIIKEKISTEYFYARIDLTLECNKSDIIKLTTDEILSENFNGNIYLNEIEPLGSGLKNFIFVYFEDDGNSATVHTVDEEETQKILYQQISYALFDMAKSNKIIQSGGQYKNMYFNKYLKYKNKYIELKSLSNK